MINASGYQHWSDSLTLVRLFGDQVGAVRLVGGGGAGDRGQQPCGDADGGTAGAKDSGLAGDAGCVDELGRAGGSQLRNGFRSLS